MAEQPLTYGHIGGRYVLPVGSDGPAPVEPVPAEGMTVSLVPAVVQHRTSNPSTTVVRPTVACVVGPDGLLRETATAEPGVRVVTGVYRVTFGGLPLHARPASFDVEVTDAHTAADPLWLPDAAPYVPPPGTVVRVVALPEGPPPTAGQVIGWDGAGLDWHPSVVVSETQPEQTGVLWLGPDHDHLADPLDATGQPAGVVPTAQGDGSWTWVAGGAVQDTGVVSLRHLVDDTFFIRSYTSVDVHRVGSVVSLSMNLWTRTWPDTFPKTVLTIPEGFRPKLATAELHGGSSGWYVRAYADSLAMQTDDAPPPPGNMQRFEGATTYLTTDPFPEV